jgi:polyhydroxyalkanoate synthesis regulator phasin
MSAADPNVRFADSLLADVKDNLSGQSTDALRALVADLKSANDAKQRQVDSLNSQMADSRERGDPRSVSPDRASDFTTPPRQHFSPGRSDQSLSPLLRATSTPAEGMSPVKRRGSPSPGPSQRIGASAEKLAEWDSALWRILEGEDALWESSAVPPVPAYPFLAIEDPAEQTCEASILQLLSVYRDVVRRLDLARAQGRIKVIEEVAAESHRQTMELLGKEMESAWTIWKERETALERDLAQVNTEIDELRRRISNLELEEHAILEEIARQKTLRMVPQHQISVVQVDLKSVRTAMTQHEAEFRARSTEDAAKVDASLAELDYLNRELGLLRQRNMGEENRVRENLTKQEEVQKQKANELDNYKRSMQPLLREYDRLMQNEHNGIYERARELKELSYRHRQELLELAST